MTGFGARFRILKGSGNILKKKQRRFFDEPKAVEVLGFVERHRDAFSGRAPAVRLWMSAMRGFAGIRQSSAVAAARSDLGPR